ncbi:MAG: hypothetical protein UIB63_09570 [Methanobrevibacter sp.]|nr:hypothetical protein [Methanobrevibacter sp.]MEE0943342.1 hypothetical protein [Methanobrevibacter sp.]
MHQDDFYELFYSNLKKELDEEYVESIEDLINKNKFTKNNFMKLIEGEIK